MSKEEITSLQVITILMYSGWRYPMKRRLISIFLIAVMALSLFACGGKKDVLSKFEDELKSRNIAYEKV